MHRSSFAIFTIIALGFVSTLAANGSTNRTTTVEKFELERYLGVWHEIARFDHKFERNLVDVTVRYTLMTDGRIQLYNRGYNTKKREWSSVIGKAHTTNRVGKLRVSFFWIFYSDYNILALGESSDHPTRPYTWALVGSRSHKYLWILARTASIDSKTLDSIIDIAQERGYDTSNLQTIAPINNYIK